MVNLIIRKKVFTKERRWKGKVTPAKETLFTVSIIPGKSIRVIYKGIPGQNPPADKTFNLGDMAEYSSYNLSYYGKITAIGENTVTIQHDEGKSSEKSRLSLHEFCWRNYNFDLEKTAARNLQLLQEI